MTNLRDELTALRVIFNQDQEYNAATPKQIGAMNSLLSKLLENQKNRIPVVKLITGLENLTSTKQLTMHTVSILINLLKIKHDVTDNPSDKENWEVSEYGKKLIGTCEEYVKKQPDIQQIRIGEAWNATSLPDMQPANQGGR